jgi:hypothetical protein
MFGIVEQITPDTRVGHDGTGGGNAGSTMEVGLTGSAGRTDGVSE